MQMNQPFRVIWFLISFALASMTWVVPSRAMVDAVFVQGDRTYRITGRVLVEAADGGLLLESRDSKIWAIQPDEFQSRSKR